MTLTRSNSEPLDRIDKDGIFLLVKHNLEKKRLRPEVRREQLVRSALSAFAEHGVSRATHSHVAKLSGISVPAVHSYFRTREDLQSAVLDVVEAYLIEIVTDSLCAAVPVAQALDTLATLFANEAHEKSDIIKVWLDWSTGVRANVWPRYLVLLGKLHAVAADLFERGKREGEIHPTLDVNATARLFIGGGHTLALMQFADVSDEDVKVFIDHLTRSVMAIGKSDPVSCDQ